VNGGAASVGGALVTAVPWLEQALLVGVAASRFAFAFLMVPLFSRAIVPATVRNSIIVAFGLIALAMPINFDPARLSASEWLTLYAREAVAGVTIGFFFGTMLWALAAAGEIIDTKIGATIGQIVDPLSEANETLTSVMMSRFGQIVFVSAGGITLFVGSVMVSYAAWPLGPGGLTLDPRALVLFEGEFGRLFSTAFIFAAPVLLVLYVIDAGLGLLNRFAQQFNVFSMSMPIKSAAATMVLIILLPLIASTIEADLNQRTAVTQGVLDRVGKPLPPRPNGAPPR